MFVIVNEKRTEYWSNEDGWVDLISATHFSEADTKVFHLPTDGQWVTLWEVNSLQFARLIAECESCGVFADNERMMLVADSMDLDTDEVFELVERAQAEWDEYKVRH